MATFCRGEDIEFDLFGLRLHAKRWGDPEGEPTIGLHGWLDNANTFDHLAPLLPELNLIAVDFAGHGQSVTEATWSRRMATNVRGFMGLG